MEIIAGLVSAVAVLVLILGGYVGRPGGLSTAAKMLAGGFLVAGLMVLVALILDRL
jgi:hypothetical protein